ncbi:hypothetical protein NHH03_03665 [Stieleria sp. TO1_6]|uniref:hypothetical protein n=1 Tax=Stieleria tagensis TaxID=2956795 RepID=UPI00209B83A3|nr:hypothetical protein [Stieleria tagensis]MCO8120823.1 hypothetical protein [Stieleria tagensis]
MPALPRGVVWVISCVLIIGGLAYLYGATASPAMEPLFAGRTLRDVELDQVSIAFSAAGLTDWRRDDGQMLIPRQTRHKYLAVLEQSSALPYALKSNVDAAFSGGNFLESESARRRRHHHAKSQDLGYKIATFSDIAWASVTYDEQISGGFDPQVIQSASVLLIPKDNKPLLPSRISMIQDLICGAYAGMQIDQVTVTDTCAQKTYNGSEDPKVRQQRQSEYELEQRLTQLLSGYTGLRIAVTSTAPSGPDDPSQPDDSRPQGSAPNHRDASKKWVSVGVPESQFHAQWISDFKTRYPEQTVPARPTPQQLAEVRRSVIGNIRDAIGPLVQATSMDDQQVIKIWSYPDLPNTPLYATAAPWPQSVRELVQIARSHAAVALSVGCLLLVGLGIGLAAMRMRMRSTAINSRAGEDASHRQAAASPSDRPGAAMPAVSSAEETTLRDDLADLVESNPELAAQIVHSWIADAA